MGLDGDVVTVVAGPVGLVDVVVVRDAAGVVVETSAVVVELTAVVEVVVKAPGCVEGAAV